MLIPIFLVLLSLLILFAGAEGLVRGSASLAIRAGLSPLFVGLTIVAFGTSSPELFVSLKATLAGQGDISVGNVLGSNSFNIGIILGLTALICPIKVDLQVIKFDAPLAFLVSLLVPLLLLGGVVSRGEGVLLFSGLLAYIGWSFYMARKSSDIVGEKPLSDDDPKPLKHWALDICFILGGLGVLILGSNLLVDNAVALARGLGVSEAVIGLTIIAAGTSMPELATSTMAALRKQSDIAIGNVVGSNLFNVLGILGVTSMVTPIRITEIASSDYWVMIGFSLVLLPLLWTDKLLKRMEGVLLLVGYAGYLWLLWPT